MSVQNNNHLSVGVLYKINDTGVLVWGYDPTYAQTSKLSREDSRTWRKRRMLKPGDMFLFLGTVSEPEAIVSCHQLLLDDGIYRFWGALHFVALDIR